MKIIVMPGDKCAFEDCDKPATEIACGRSYEWDDDNTKGHAGVAVYCLDHARIVSDEHSPEYIENCPNCGCHFGVN
jgi:hypothetical protein